MSELLDRLPANQLKRHLLGAKRAGIESKARQRTSGRSGQLSYEVKTNNTWDVTGSVSSGGFRQVTIELTADADWPIGVPVVDIYFNGTNESNRPSVGITGVYSWVSGANEAYVEEIKILSGRLEEPRKLVWRFNMFFYGNITYYIKARPRCSSSGTLTVTAV